MGKVIRFPIERRLASTQSEPRAHEGSASILILPVIRIERHFDEPAGAPGTGNSPGRGRRRPATR